jgi:hypothetical protein
MVIYFFENLVKKNFLNLSRYGALDAMSGLNQGTPSPVSSANSSQDSLHKHCQKKRSIKNSFGRLFNKKDKTGKFKNQAMADHQRAQDASTLQSLSDSEAFSPHDGTLDRKDMLASDFDRRRKKKYTSMKLVFT